MQEATRKTLNITNKKRLSVQKKQKKEKKKALSNSPFGAHCPSSKRKDFKEKPKSDVGQLKKTGVLIMPGNVFDLSGNFFRVGFGKKNMIEALDRFEQFLKHYGK